MIDVIEVIGQRIAYEAVYRPYPGGGGYSGGTFCRDRSDLKIEFEEITYGNLYPFESKPIIVETSSYGNDTSIADKQVFSVNKKHLPHLLTRSRKVLAQSSKSARRSPFLAVFKRR